MLSVLDLYNLEREENRLAHGRDVDLAQNSFNLGNVLINRDVKLSDQERQFRRLFETFRNVYSRRGLETSGIRAQGIDRVNADNQRLGARTEIDAQRQAANLVTQRGNIGENYIRGITDVGAYRNAARQSTASQIRGIQGV